MGVKDFAAGLGKFLYRTPKTVLDQSVSDYTSSDMEEGVVIENEEITHHEEANIVPPVKKLEDSENNNTQTADVKKDHRWKTTNQSNSQKTLPKPLLPDEVQFNLTDEATSPEINSDQKIIELISNEIINNKIVLDKLVNKTASYLVREYSDSFSKLDEQQQALLDRVLAAKINPTFVIKLSNLIKEDIEQFISNYMDQKNG